jgi:hypothetical protein
LLPSLIDEMTRITSSTSITPCLQDLIYNFKNTAPDVDATSEYKEAAAPPTEGEYVEGEYEIRETGINAGSVDYLEDADPVLLLAASIRLPDKEDDNLEEGIEAVGPFVDNVSTGDATAPTSMGIADKAPFSLPSTSLASGHDHELTRPYRCHVDMAFGVLRGPAHRGKGGHGRAAGHLSPGSKSDHPGG